MPSIYQPRYPEICPRLVLCRLSQIGQHAALAAVLIVMLWHLPSMFWGHPAVVAAESQLKEPVAAAAAASAPAAAHVTVTPPEFFRGLNLNGPAVTINGHEWAGSDSKEYRCSDMAFENQDVPLVPETDSERAKMIRSSRWGGNRVDLTNIPAGRYSLFLFVWEDNSPETYAIRINDRLVVKEYNSRGAGQWDRLGPWTFQVTDAGTVRLSSFGGAANFSGIELWRGVIPKQTAERPAGTPEQLAFFEQKIRPVLIEKCYECHGAEPAIAEAKLRLDTRDAVLAGGRSGPGLIPGDPEKSLLYQALQYHEDGLQMPPDEKLPAHVIADFANWIRDGAADPRGGSSETGAQKSLAAIQKEAGSRWSLQPVVNHPLPDVADSTWPKTGIDYFILNKLTAASLTPTADADRRTLIRRVTFDLIGLPPTPEDVATFVNDSSPDAYDKLIERLLASEQYGERWGRRWLDVARYSDTAGDNSDFPIPQMYLYRNWVIAALNRDLPYDQFVREQLAGDLLPATTTQEPQATQERHARQIATGYIANARRFGSRVDDYPTHLTIEDTIDNLGRAYLGLSLNCARCHDHKFDPISTEDYYALYGFFDSTKYPWPGIELEQRQRDLVPLIDAATADAALAAHRARQEELDNIVVAIERKRDAAPEAERESFKKPIEEARETSQQHSKTPLGIPLAYAVQDRQEPFDAELQYRGDPLKTGPAVPRRFPMALGGQSLDSDDATSGRLSLANWIVDRANPLTARVMVNRIWAWHFGRGLVPTPNDFGKQGQPASHPELLDWLATRFMESGWSMKEMHRLILRSHVYQTSAIQEPALIPGDPGNVLLSGFRRQRLDSDVIRDSLLFVSGTLDPTPGGPHPFPPSTEWSFTQHNPFRAVYDTNRRSVYLMTQRIQRHPYLAIFDGADPSASTPQRLVSTTPLQALYLMNDPFVHLQAEHLAARVIARSPTNAERIDWVYQLLFSRSPTAEELASGSDYLQRAQQLLVEAGSSSNEAELPAWQSYARSLLTLNEFVYCD